MCFVFGLYWGYWEVVASRWAIVGGNRSGWGTHQPSPLTPTVLSPSTLVYFPVPITTYLEKDKFKGERVIRGCSSSVQFIMVRE